MRYAAATGANVGEIGNGQLGLGQQRQQPQAGLLAGRLERRIESIETELATAAHGLPLGWFPLYKDIFIR